MRAITFAILASATTTNARPSGLVLPQVATAIACDGELDEVAWRTPARTGAFLDARGEQAAPYSDARFLRDDKYLYLALYAADEDIRATDEFVVVLAGGAGKRAAWHFTADGKMSPKITNAHVAVDVDGSVGNPADDDEEWVIEAAVPLEAVPFAADGTVALDISRCDLTKDHVQRCGKWRGLVVKR